MSVSTSLLSSLLLRMIGGSDKVEEEEEEGEEKEEGERGEEEVEGV